VSCGFKFLQFLSLVNSGDIACLNFRDRLRLHPCGERVLIQYVLKSGKAEDIACDHIPVDQERRTPYARVRLGGEQAFTAAVRDAAAGPKPFVSKNGYSPTAHCLFCACVFDVRA
jgi:hypothetical protein